MTTDIDDLEQRLDGLTITLTRHECQELIDELRRLQLAEMAIESKLIVAEEYCKIRKSYGFEDEELRKLGMRASHIRECFSAFGTSTG